MNKEEDKNKFIKSERRYQNIVKERESNKKNRDTENEAKEQEREREKKREKKRGEQKTGVNE